MKDTKQNTVIVTRHLALVELLRERGIVGGGARIIEHVTPEDVRGRDVIGVLPLHLAALAQQVTEIPLALTPEMRGRELGLDELRSIAGDPVTYKVTVVNGWALLVTDVVSSNAHRIATRGEALAWVKEPILNDDGTDWGRWVLHSLHDTKVSAMDEADQFLKE